MEHNLDQELLDKIDAFIKGQLKGDDLNVFNAQLKKSPALREEVNIQRKLFSTLNVSNLSWDITDKETFESKTEINKDDYQLISEKIKRVGAIYKSEEETVIPIWTKLKKYGYAAAVVLALLASFNLFENLISSNDHQYNHTQWAALLPSFAEKSSELNPFTKAEAQFKAQNLEAAIDLFNTIDKDNKYYPYSLMYLGASYDLLDKNDDAISAFDELINLKDFEGNSKGLWFKSKIYFKLKNNLDAISTLKIITQDQNNFYYKEAIELLSELD